MADASRRRALGFPAGPVDTTGWPESHPGDVTPTTLTYEHLGNHAVEPTRSALLECHPCRVQWHGCAAANDCPRCGNEVDVPFADPRVDLVLAVIDARGELRLAQAELAAFDSQHGGQR
jgi:hypothetical protein